MSPGRLWTPPIALALLTWATLQNLCLCVEEELKKLPQNKIAVVSQFLLQAHLLRGLKTPFRVLKETPLSILSLLCTHGASVNKQVQSFTPAGSGDHPSDWEMNLTPATHLSPSEIAFSDRAKGLTVWEMYLRTEGDTQGHEHFSVLKALLELDVDLDCKLPDSCSNIKEAIRKTFDERWEDKYEERIDTALLKRGYIPEPTIDEKVHSDSEHSEVHDDSEDSDPAYDSQGALKELAEEAI